jgi:hypothetical protein
VTPPFPARFDGTCAADCENRIHPGDRVQYVDGQLMHAACAPAPEPTEQPQEPPVCGVCWQTKPCRCDG